MAATDPRIDAYIEDAQDFAKPILGYLRNFVHENCPDVEEGWKWSFPNFIYKGKILCSMVAFKKHCAFGFWLEKEIKAMQKLTKHIDKKSMFRLGKITKIEDLPPKAELKSAIKEAMELTDMGIVIKKASPQKVEVEMPDFFTAALKRNKAANTVFEKASPSFRKEYILWITAAKTDATRIKRMEQANRMDCRRKRQKLQIRKMIIINSKK